MENDDRWGPWMDTLYAHAAPLCTPHERTVEDGVVWLEWTQSLRDDKDKATVEKAVQALELLACLAETNQKKWRNMVGDKWPVLVQHWMAESEEKVLRLGCIVRADAVGVVTKMCSRFLKGTTTNVTSAYGDLRRELENVYAHEEKLPVIPIRLAFVEDSRGNDYIEAIRDMTYVNAEGNHQGHGRTLIDTCVIGQETRIATGESYNDLMKRLGDSYVTRLKETLELLVDRLRASQEIDYNDQPTPSKMSKTQKKKPHKTLSQVSWPSLFRITQMEAVGCEGLHSSSTFTAKTVLMALGVEQRNLRFDYADINEDNASIYATYLMDCLDSREAVDPSAPAIVPVKSVGVSQFMLRQSYDSIFTAILSSNSIRKLRVGTLDLLNPARRVTMDRCHRERLWQWMGVVSVISSVHSTKFIFGHRSSH